MNTGIALLNLGGPWTLKDVKPFLYRLFVNPSVLVGLPAPFRQVLAYTIAQVEGPFSIKSHESIGGGTPQLGRTELQAEGLRRLTGNGRVRVEIGMRSAEPSIENALKELKDWRAEKLVLLLLFPHFSTTTSGTCFDEAREVPERLLFGNHTGQVSLRGMIEFGRRAQLNGEDSNRDVQDRIKRERVASSLSCLSRTSLLSSFSINL